MTTFVFATTTVFVTPANPIPDVTDAEWDVLDALWQESPASAVQVHKQLLSRKAWSLGTVKTLLQRLFAKGAVTRTPERTWFVYKPAFTKRAWLRHASKDLMRRAGDAEKSPMLAFFLKETKLDDAELARLRALLDELQGDAR